MAGKGGARPGAGRKPTRERFAKPVEQAEKRIADHLPELVERFLALADTGDYRALAYLVDRILGKPVEAVHTEVTGKGGEPLTVRVVYDDQLPDPDHQPAEAAPRAGAGAP